MLVCQLPFLFYVWAHDPLDEHHYPFHHREAHPHKVLFQSHTLDTQRVPDIHGRLQAQRFAFSAFSWLGSLLTSRESKRLDEDSTDRIWLVQIKSDVSINKEIRDQISAEMGLSLGAYLPHNTYLVYGPGQSAQKALQHPAVGWVGQMPEEAKIVGDTLRLINKHPRDSPAGLSDDHLLIDSPWLRTDPTTQPLPEAEQQQQVELSLLLQLAEPAPQRTLETTKQLAVEILSAWQADESPSVIQSVEPVGVHQLSVKIVFSATARVSDLSKLVKALANRPEVMAVEKFTQPRILNMFARGIVQNGNKDGTTPIFNIQQLKGQGEIIGVADSGLDYDHCFFSDYVGSTNTPWDFMSNEKNPSGRKVLAYHKIGNADYKDDANGHGTHVCGSIVGSPPAGHPEMAAYGGTAPEAKLIFADVGTAEGLVGLSGNTDVGRDILDVAYKEGARIHSNSWGSSTPDYTSIARSIDQYVWTHPDMFVLVAAGNDGVKPGVITGTVGSPATMKNGIAIGASQTTNVGWTDSLDFTDWNEKLAQAKEQVSDLQNCCDYPNNNVKQYCCKSAVAASISGTGPAGKSLHYEECMADFSSRGPTLDGRIKPELVAPGQYIISSRSDGMRRTPALNPRPNFPSSCTGDQCCPPPSSGDKSDSDLLSMAGTSMATPVSAGTAALVRQYFREGYYPTGVKVATNEVAAPPSTLLIATLANGAHTLTGKIDLNNDGKEYVPLDKPGVWPIIQIFQGFGRIDLSQSLRFSGAGSTAATRPDFYAHWTEQLETDQVVLYKLVVGSASTLKATLVWADYPGTLNTNLTSVNNLDLIVGSTVSDAVAGNFITKRDTKNNIEHAFFKTNSSSQTVYVLVRGYDVPQGPQPYALVVSGDFTNDVGADRFAKCDPRTCAQVFNVPKDYFEPAGDAEHFPYGPVIGGTVGALSFLAILIYIVKWYLAQQQGQSGGDGERSNPMDQMAEFANQLEG
eukprot:gb/GEZN01001143.1/.p1 GENE.gb/GEZN01001143.1/~~gb/GEZN01001143.1/.p1  ORF type:complete len:971 (-),score=151.65 gb/GEZN01001143.1/:310-3222(-)